MTATQRFDADWRRTAYAVPIALCSALIMLSTGRWLLQAAGVLAHGDGVFGGTVLLPALWLIYLVVFEIPGRKLILRTDAITLETWRDTKTFFWSDIEEVQPGQSAWMNINRQLPVAARLVVSGTVETVPISNVFRPTRQEIFDTVRNYWLVSRVGRAK